MPKSWSRRWPRRRNAPRRFWRRFGSGQNATRSLDQLQALTLAERLRKVGDEEKGLGGQLPRSGQHGGPAAQELPEKFKLLNALFVKHQGGARDQSAALQAEISRFLSAPKKPNYGKVARNEGFPCLR